MPVRDDGIAHRDTGDSRRTLRRHALHDRRATRRALGAGGRTSITVSRPAAHQP